MIVIDKRKSGCCWLGQILCSCMDNFSTWIYRFYANKISIQSSSLSRSRFYTLKSGKTVLAELACGKWKKKKKLISSKTIFRHWTNGSKTHYYTTNISRISLNVTWISFLLGSSSKLRMMDPIGLSNPFLSALCLN